MENESNISLGGAINLHTLIALTIFVGRKKIILNQSFSTVSNFVKYLRVFPPIEVITIHNMQNKYLVNISYLTQRDIPSRNYTSLLLGSMVKIRPSGFNLFGCLDSAVWTSSISFDN